ncbi:MAG: hypothetical protein WAK62_04055, partial [Terriglobales bacterium]
YTAAFLAPALQLVVSNFKSAKYVLGTGAVLFAVAGLVVSVNIYSGVVGGISYPKLDEVFLFRVSLLLFASSLGFAVLVTLIQDQIANPNIDKSEEEEQRNLNERFSGKRPEPATGSGAATPQQDEPEVASEQDLASKFKGADEPRSAGTEEKNG